jgi:hypothetical protein
VETVDARGKVRQRENRDIINRNNIGTNKQTAERTKGAAGGGASDGRDKSMMEARTGSKIHTKG